ncbi:MAG: nucleoside 2-deoxyribosyltransferase [Actinomycetota bacterium]|nr:nucleoside 2-deoxyribosyltransferase [Actinomycetota bacterium]
MQNRTAYIAGPLFNEGERWWVEELEQAVVSIGFETFLPHRDNPPKTPETVQTIFENNRKGIESADIVIANLNGITTDDGTAWELGYASALNIPSIGIFTDWRSRFEGEEVINLMIGRSLDHVARSINELLDILGSWKES